MNSGVCKHSRKGFDELGKREIDERNAVVLVGKHRRTVKSVDGLDFTQLFALFHKQSVFLDLVDKEHTLVFGIVLGDFLILFGKRADRF